MGESCAKKAAYQLLSLITPLFHRCGGPPSPKGKAKSFPFGGAGRALALTEEGRCGREYPVIV